MIKIKKLNIHYTRGITAKREKGREANVRDLTHGHWATQLRRNIAAVANR